MATTPDAITDLLNEVLACACDALEAQSHCFCPCRHFISVGPPVWDTAACCSDGQLTVHLDRVYPFSNFPAQSNQVNLCQTPLAIDFNVNLLRCYPTMDEDGNPPTHEQLQTAGEELVRDAFILTTGLLCCLAAKGRSRKYVYLGSRLTGPQGGCAGVEVRFTVEIG